MMNSKLRAYRLVNDEWEAVNRWTLLKMADTEYRKYKAKYFPLYLSKSKESPQLTFNIGQKTFRFMPNQGLNENHSSKGITIAHQLAQEVISEIRTINLKIKDKRTKPYKEDEITIEVDNVILEKKIDAYGNVYFADILILFSKPYELSLQWNGFLVLEIFVTSDTHGQKIIDFEKKKIPLLEVSIGSNLRLNKSACETTEMEEEKLRGIMHGVFRKQIFCSLHVSPTSDKFKENKVIHDYKNELERLQIELHQSRENTDRQLAINRSFESDIRDLKDVCRNKEKLICNLKSELRAKNELIDALKNKSFFKKLVDLVNYKRCTIE